MTESLASAARVVTDGKFLRLGGDKFYVKGFSYGPFKPNSQGGQFPERDRLLEDFAHMRRLGANTLRLYTRPSVEMLDDILLSGLKALLDVPWEKHRCFFEDWSATEDARREVLNTAKLAANHPAVLAISVVNEFPNDVVRFYGHERIERFVTELSDSVKQIAPDCLTTFSNYPTTEFLQAQGLDFCCFNVYLNDVERLAYYLDRLQHIAGDRPLVLGEFGLDAVRHGQLTQAELLAKHVRTVFEHGLAGSIVFSYTDDWYTGGHQMEGWGFGVTDAQRKEKRAALSLAAAWQEAPFGHQQNLPKVSVVVCAYNAGSTLRGCLESLTRVNYPDYEVIVVNDGSWDATGTIAAEFPQFATITQTNRGLSYARNVGAEYATGEIVVYTDADCVVDDDWLRCLVQAMQDQGVDAIGGPNITPRSDGWSAQCVAVSPGNPSHVMLDDHHAEHVPGCNMAFRRDLLLRLGGFDPQFRVAGDDVDLCWRLLDFGGTIGYASGAFVWHHRRETVSAYLKQQRGYGRAEAILLFMHPQRFSVIGRCIWHGRIYGAGAAGLPLIPERIYYGPFGCAPYQMIYRHNEYGTWACVMWLEWHVLALFLLAVGLLTFWPLAALGVLMWVGTTLVAVKSARSARFPKDAPWWCRPLVAVLNILQPVVREWTRVTYDLRMWRPKLSIQHAPHGLAVKEISPQIVDLYWQSERGVGREALLEEIRSEAAREGWLGVFNNAWAPWDVKLVGDLWHTLYLHTASEELGGNKRFTRARIISKPTVINRVASIGSLLWAAASLFALSYTALPIALLATAGALWQNIASRRSCLRAASQLVSLAGRHAGLHAFDNPTVEPESADVAPILAPVPKVTVGA
jgi:GT2 family glycosyltransferase